MTTAPRPTRARSLRTARLAELARSLRSSLTLPTAIQEKVALSGGPAKRIGEEGGGSLTSDHDRHRHRARQGPNPWSSDFHARAR